MGIRMETTGKSKSRLGMNGLALLAAVTLLLAGCSQEQAGPEQATETPAVTVKAMEVQYEPFVASVQVTGTLVSNTLVEVKAETTGRILKLSKDQGDRVAAGEAVAWVNEENYRIALLQAETSVQVAEATLERVRVLEAHSRTEMERARNLIKSGGITDKDLQAADVAERETGAQVALAEAQLAQTRAALAQAEKRLRDTVIRAPVSGEIVRRFVNPGAYVEPPTPVFTIVDNKLLELEAPVPSAQLGQVRSGQRVTFRVNSYPDMVFEGRVLEISPTVDQLTRAASARVQVNNSSGNLKAGMFAQGEVITGAQQQSIVISAEAAYRSNGAGSDSYVFVVENNKAVQRKVSLGQEMNSRVVVTEGLQPGDVLIAEQRIELAEGVRVETGE